MKDLVTKLKEATNGLSNLSEKDALEYEDVNIDELNEKEINQDFNEIAKSLSEMEEKYKFDEDEEYFVHKSIHCNEEISKKIGVDSIVICPYKGVIHSEFLDSNFMWSCDKEGRNCLYIDIYDTFFLFKEDIYEAIMTELYNFKRDAQWVVDGVYDDKMKDFK